MANGQTPSERLTLRGITTFNADHGVEEPEVPHRAGGFPRRLSVDLNRDPAALLLGIGPQKGCAERPSTVRTAGSFTAARTNEMLLLMHRTDKRSQVHPHDNSFSVILWDRTWALTGRSPKIIHQASEAHPEQHGL